MIDYRAGLLHVGGVSAAELAAAHGTPLYLYDADTIRRQIGRLREAFASLPFAPFYAVKANGNLALLELFRRQGFGCDAVSPGEIFLARKAGFPGERIWFTCSNVSDDDFRALQDPAIVVNLNSFSEVERFLRLGLPNPLALRLNPEVGAGHHLEVVTGGFGVKFGIELEAVEATARLLAAEGRDVAGLHVHIGSGIDDPAVLLEAAATLLEQAPRFPSLSWLNFGGGLGVPYRPGEPDFPIAEYASQLERLAAPVLAERGLTAILEPGRYLVAEAGMLLTRVTTRRRIGGQLWLGCDTGLNHLARPSRYGAYHHILNASRGAEEDLRWHAAAGQRLTAREESREATGEEAIVAGNICESGDVFTRDAARPVPRLLPPTREGDLLAICDAGAYGFSMASHYNSRRLPAEVLVDGGRPLLIRERERHEELLRNQVRLGSEPAQGSGRSQGVAPGVER